jgi:hypothetical protein
MHWRCMSHDPRCRMWGPLGDIATASGYGGYLHPAFDIQLYNDDLGLPAVASKKITTNRRW